MVSGVSLSLILLTAEEDPLAAAGAPSSSSTSELDGHCNTNQEGSQKILQFFCTLIIFLVRCRSVLCQCTRAYLEALRHPRAALSTWYYAVLATSWVKKALNKVNSQPQCGCGLENFCCLLETEEGIGKMGCRGKWRSCDPQHGASTGICL